MAIPTGTIILWTQATIPEGWSIYEAANGKFIRGVLVGGGAGVTGGATSHSHTPGGAVSGGTHSHGNKSFYYGYHGNTSQISAGTGTQDMSFATSHNHTGNFSLGSGGAHTHTFSSQSGGASNMPPYKTARYIIKN